MVNLSALLNAKNEFRKELRLAQFAFGLLNAPRRPYRRIGVSDRALRLIDRVT